MSDSRVCSIAVVSTPIRENENKEKRQFYSVFALTEVAPSFTSPFVQVVALDVSSFIPFHVAEHPVQSSNAVAISSVRFMLIPFFE